MASFKILLGWELPDELIQVENEKRPMVISKEYSLSLGKKSNLRRDLVAWRGREFSQEELMGFVVEKVLDKGCLLNVVHKQSVDGSRLYANIAGISPLAKSMVLKPRYHKLVHFEIEMGANDVFKALPEWIQKKIQSCEEWIHPPTLDKEEPQPEPTPEAPPEEDEVPF